jgi:hypothetical protein
MTDGFAVEDEMPGSITAETFDDEVLIENLARGVLDETLPSAYRTLVGVLGAVRQPATDAESEAETAAVALFRSLRPHTTPARRSSMHHRLLSPRVLIAAGAISLASATGAAAATGSLPGAAQDTAATVLARIGITVPGANSHSGGHPDTRGRSGVGTNDATTPPTTARAANTVTTNKGQTISSLATDRSTTGIAKAEAVSSAASGGHSKAGMNGQPSSATGDTPSSVSAGTRSATPVGPPVSVPVGPPSSVPVGPPSSVPVGPPVSVPVGPPSSVPVGPPVSVPVGPPASHPVFPPSSGPPSSVPSSGPPSSVPGPPHRP